MTVSPLYDEALVLLKVVRGDQDAFRVVFDRYRDKVYFFALKLVHQPSQAEEIVQDVFLKIWVNRQSLANVQNFDNYLCTITRNHAFNILKRCAHEKQITAELNRQSSTNDISTENIILQHDYERILLQAVEKLPPQQKLVYIMSREKGLKRAEIARELNISPETVKAHMYAALKFIRSSFNLPEHAFSMIAALCVLAQQ